MDAKIKKAGDILKKLVADFNFPSTGKTLLGQWPSMVGEDMASHVRIRDIVNNVLFLVADHPGWIQITTIRKKELISLIGKEFPEKKINDIKISLDKQQSIDS